jgi:Protein of unknown function (DUF3046)
VRLSEFWHRMDLRFGDTYARSIAHDYRLSALGATVEEALEKGVSPKVIWQSVCKELDVSPTLH